MAITGEETIRIEAPAEQVWAAITDIASHADWQSGVKSVEVKERDGEGRPKVVESVSDAKIKDVRYELSYTYEDGRKMSWSFIDGDVSDMTGFYELEPDGEACELTFRLDVDPGRRLGLLLRGPVVDKVRSFVMGGTLKDIKKHVESGARA